MANSFPSHSELARFALMCAAAEAAGPVPSQDGSGAALPLPHPPAWMLAARRLAGWITARDVLFQVGPIVIDSQQIMYGWVLESDADCTAIIRGTADMVEWAEDADGVPVDYPAGGKVERGFAELVRSLLFRPVSGPERPLEDALAGKPATITGHSLGAAMGSILTLNLARAGVQVSGRYFESPRPGDADFARAFGAKVSDYVVVRYAPDLVPDLPPIGFSALGNVFELPANPAICDNPLCNHHAINISWLLDNSATTIVSGCEVKP